MIVEAGATAVIQPGGSMRDGKVIAAADQAGLALRDGGESLVDGRDLPARSRRAGVGLCAAELRFGEGRQARP